MDEPPAWIESAIRDTIRRHEGGFQDDPEDDGNWTGGKQGIGKLKGTKYGISAATYPHLDIPNLTVEDAVHIYWRDWWDGSMRWLQKLGAPSVAAKIFDLGITMGPRRIVTIAQRAANNAGANITVDGHAGPQTIAAINRIPHARFLDALKLEASGHYRRIAWKYPKKRKYLAGWLNRVYA